MKKGATQKPKARSRSKSATRPKAQPMVQPQQHRPHSEAGPSKGQESLQRTMWKQKGESIPGVGVQHAQKGKSILGNLPEISNQFGPLDEENETDYLTRPPAPTMAEFFTTIFEMAEKQARVNRGRNSNRDPRLRVNQIPERTDKPISNKVTSPLKDPLQDKDATNEVPQMTIHGETLMQIIDESEPAGIISEHGEPSVRQGRSSKKKGDVKRRKSRSKSRPKGESGGEDPEVDPGPCQ